MAWYELDVVIGSVSCTFCPFNHSVRKCLLHSVLSGYFRVWRSTYVLQSLLLYSTVSFVFAHSTFVSDGVPCTMLLDILRLWRSTCVLWCKLSLAVSFIALPNTHPFIQEKNLSYFWQTLTLFMVYLAMFLEHHKQLLCIKRSLQLQCLYVS